MIKSTLIPLLIAIPSHCAPTNPPALPVKPDCPGYTLILNRLGDETDCDVNPPQIMGAYIPMTDDYLNLCDDSGGRIIWVDPVNSMTLCMNLDY